MIIYASNGKVESVNYARPNELYMEFYDKQKKKKVYSGEILLISPTKIRWILKDDEGVYVNEDWVESGFFGTIGYYTHKRINICFEKEAVTKKVSLLL